MAGDAELMTGELRCYNFLPGIPPVAYFFTGAVSLDEISRVVHKEEGPV